MSVFGRATFSAAGYAAFRPSYPSSLFKTVLAFHNAHSRGGGTLLDLGCGHGLIARELSSSFDKVIATDPSEGMIKQAAQMTNTPNVTFRQSGAEDLGFVPDNSVDMVVSGQAAHWFDYTKTWPELARVVKRGGSLAFWGYRDNILVGHQRANEILLKFCYGEGEIEPGLEGMNKYWERPGRDKVRNLLREVEPPKHDWEDVRRILCDIKPDTNVLPDPEEAWLQQRITLGGLEGYLHTFSAVQGWKDAHPEMVGRANGGEGDLVDIIMDRIVESEPQWKAMGEGWRDAEVNTVWGTYILLARRS